eukprot:6177413-Pleurochrysis_carterae.AAC.2
MYAPLHSGRTRVSKQPAYILQQTTIAAADTCSHLSSTTHNEQSQGLRRGHAVATPTLFQSGFYSHALSSAFAAPEQDDREDARRKKPHLALDHWQCPAYARSAARIIRGRRRMRPCCSRKLYVRCSCKRSDGIRLEQHAHSRQQVPCSLHRPCSHSAA